METTNIPERKKGEKLDNAEKIKDRMPKFAEWMQSKIESLSDEKKEKAEEIASKAKREGFWMNEETIYNIHIIHDVDMNKIEKDVLDAVEEAFGDEED